MTAPTTNRPDQAILGLGYHGLTQAVEAVRAGLVIAGYGNPLPRLPEPFGIPESLRADLAIRMQAHTANRAPAVPRRTMVDAVDLAPLGSGSHEQAGSPPVGMLNAMVAGYRAHERRVGREPLPIDHGQREARDAR